MTNETLDCIKDQRVCRWDSYRGTDGPEGQGRLSYGDLKTLHAKEVTDTDFLTPEMLSGSDYGHSGSVEVSNHRIFLTRYGMLPNVYDVYGGMGTFAIAIRLDSVTPEMIEDLSTMEKCYVLDEEDHSRVEMEAESDAWESWGRSDFRRELDKRFPDLNEKLYELGAEALDTLFYTLCDRTNTYWEHEVGNNAFIRVERVAEAATEQDIQGDYE